MKTIALAIFCSFAFSSAVGAVTASATPMSVEQNGSQKVRYVVTVDGTNCWSRRAASADSPRIACEPLPVVPPAGAKLKAIGD